MNTPHIVLKNEKGFSKTVLMPGDPKRAEMIAEKYLENTEIVSDVRGIKAIRGQYSSRMTGHKYDVTVMASGMGMPSIGIYSHELFNFFGVENIIRIGSAGAINRKLKLGDIVIAQGACTNSNYFAQYQLDGGTYSAISNYNILKSLVDIANEKQLDKNIIVGNILSSDTFYGYNSVDWGKLGVLATEMESAALFAEAALAGKCAGSICTISDLIFDHTQTMTAEERQNNLHNMIEIALDSVERFEK
jgi:purine-nucleoside phosphorylase